MKEILLRLKANDSFIKIRFIYEQHDIIPIFIKISTTAFCTKILPEDNLQN